MSSWSAQVTDHLLASKQQGFPWPEARRMAEQACPPRGRDAAVATLFDEQGQRHDTLTQFFWRAARNAYEDYVGPEGSGQGPALAHFRAAMLRDLDSSTPARKHRRAA